MSWGTPGPSPGPRIFSVLRGTEGAGAGHHRGGLPRGGPGPSGFGAGRIALVEKTAGGPRRAVDLADWTTIKASVRPALGARRGPGSWKRPATRGGHEHGFPRRPRPHVFGSAAQPPTAILAWGKRGPRPHGRPPAKQGRLGHLFLPQGTGVAGWRRPPPSPTAGARAGGPHAVGRTWNPRGAGGGGFRHGTPVPFSPCFVSRQSGGPIQPGGGRAPPRPVALGAWEGWGEDLFGPKGDHGFCVSL